MRRLLGGGWDAFFLTTKKIFKSLSFHNERIPGMKEAAFLAHGAKYLII
jgi:hypothetical protein